jgi:hypothetical protein
MFAAFCQPYGQVHCPDADPNKICIVNLSGHGACRLLRPDESWLTALQRQLLYAVCGRKVALDDVNENRKRLSEFMQSALGAKALFQLCGRGNVKMDELANAWRLISGVQPKLRGTHAFPSR